MRRALSGMLILAAATAGGAAHAGGIGRPNVISARAFGWGGAFTAVADDPSALHYNPAGLALQPRDAIMVGAEFIIAPRRYTPITRDPSTGELVRGEDQEPENRPNILPAIGYVTRLPSGGVPSRLAIGVGLWNTFGGALNYPKSDGAPALDHTTTAVLELVPGVAYEVNDFLAVGAAFRLGFGIFSVEATKLPADGEFSAFGVGAGASVGIMLRPARGLQVGLAWRSPLTTSTSGSGKLDLAGNGQFTSVDVAHKQEWPQQLSLGVSFRLTPTLRLSAQGDWTDWSRVNQIVVEFPGQPGLTQLTTFRVDFHDNYAVHGGAELELSPRVALRGGYTFDTNAVPDRTIERQYLDGPKHAVALGGGYQLARSWRIDTAFEYIFGSVRTVPDNRQEYTDAGWASRANKAPGEHVGQVYTFELNLQHQY